MKYYVYKTTNIVNNKIYIGVHYSDDIQKDQYLGSGKHFRRSVIKYGRDKFKRQILYQFDTKEQAYLMQRQIVDKQFVKRKDTYNLKLGGQGGWAEITGMVTVKDINGNTQKVFIDDPRYLSGQLVHITTGVVVVKDTSGKTLLVNKDDPRYLSGELVGIAKNKVPVRDAKGNKFLINKEDPRYGTDEFQFVLFGHQRNQIGKVMVKDQLGNIYSVNKHDERYLSGQLIPLTKGKKFPGRSLGIKNSQYGTIWITDGCFNKKIKSTDILPQGWKKGRSVNVAQFNQKNNI